MNGSQMLLIKKYKVQTIYTEDKELSVKENPNAVRSFCKQNGIGMVAPKLKELENEQKVYSEIGS